jgi:predicted SnoaL-like aldol condensation-catalyzing enzyme
MIVAGVMQDGRKATVVYLREGFTPCEPEKATSMKVIYEDGEVAFVRIIHLADKENAAQNTP